MNVDRLASFIQSIAHHSKGIGSISVFEKGQEVYQRDFGQDQLPKEEQQNKLYQIGSVTKTFTATLILNLIERGELKTSDTLSLFFPNVKNSADITIAHLLNHSSGLGEYIVNSNNETWLTTRQERADIIAFIEESEPLFAAGTLQQYSNAGYYLLKEIIELKYGQPYADVLQEVILSKMKVSDVYSAQQPADLVWKPYEYANGWKEIADFDFINVLGAGDLRSTPTTMNVFLNQLLAGDILDEEWVQYMEPLGTEAIFGRGLMKIRGGDSVFIGHCGDTYGTHSVMLHNRELDCSISFSLNGATYSPLVFFDEIVKVLFDDDFQFPEYREPVAYSSADLEQYVGRYSSATFPMQFAFSVRDNTLFAQGTGQPLYALVSYEYGVFEYEIGQMSFRFVPKENKMVFVYAEGEVMYDKMGL